MTPDLQAFVCRATGARAITSSQSIQALWGGYGEIRRVHLNGAAWPSAIVKSIRPPAHGRGGGAAQRSHARKLTSYRVELEWYRTYATRIGSAVRMPRLADAATSEHGWWLVLEDLDAAGFAGRPVAPSEAEIEAVLEWLARFHASTLGMSTDGLWPIGTYWHLATRPDELAEITAPRLRNLAGPLSAAIDTAEFRSLVHGDAKVENFCFGEGGRTGQVAALDFQYVGGGCGMKDVAYFLSSCRESDALLRHEASDLDVYFVALRRALRELAAAPGVDDDAVVREWRSLYPLAWADFYRFLAGWAPAYASAHAYGQRAVERSRTKLGI